MAKLYENSERVIDERVLETMLKNVSVQGLSPIHMHSWEFSVPEAQLQTEASPAPVISVKRPREEKLESENDYLRALATQERRLAARESQRCDELLKRNEQLSDMMQGLRRDNAALIKKIVDLPCMRDSAERQEYERLIRDFYRLAATWKAEVRFLSDMNEMYSHHAYQQIIDMGANVVPLILEELRRDPDYWFAALRQLTGENPVPREARGKLEDMTSAWLEWAKTHGYSENSGTDISSFRSTHRFQRKRRDAKV
jgi:hypothetical protein